MEEKKLDRRAARALLLYDAVIVLTVSAIVLALVLIVKNDGEPILLLALMLVLLAVLAAGTRLLRQWFEKSITKPINQLTDSIQKTDTENAAFLLRTGDELEALSRALWSFRKKTSSADLKNSRQLTEQANARAEADVLRRVRELLRAPVLPGGGDINAASITESTGGRSGDFCDCFFLPEERLGFVAASTETWGMAEALYLLSCRAALRSAMAAEADLTKVFLNVSQSLLELYGGEHFCLSAIAGTLDTASGELKLVNAGYPAPLLMSGDGLFAEMPTAFEKVTAGEADLSLTAASATLELGGRLILCSSAAEENPDIGLSRESLIGLLNAARTQPELPALLGSVCAGIKTVSGGMPLKSNLMMLALERSRNGKCEDALEVPADPRSFLMIRQLIEERVDVGVWPKKEYARLCVAAETLFGIICKKAESGAVRVNCGARRGGREVLLSFYAPLHHNDPLAEAESPETQGAIAFLRDAASVSFSPGGEGDRLSMVCSIEE